MSQAASTFQPRPLVHVLAIGAVITVWLAAAVAHHNMELRKAALPVHVEIRFQKNVARDDAAIAIVDMKNRCHLFCGREDGRKQSWTFERLWLRELIVAAEPTVFDAVETIHLSVGDQRVVWNSSNWRSECPPWKKQPVLDLPDRWTARHLTESVRREGSSSGKLNRLLNYRGDVGMLWHTLNQVAINPTFLLLVNCLAFGVIFRGRLATHWGVSLRAPPFRISLDEAMAHRRSFWWAAGLVIFLSCAAFLEWTQPYYFTQDDNFAQFLPGITYGGRAVFSGRIPAWNPHQFLGAPLAEVGVYALTYPFTYLSYLLAAKVLQNEFLTLEVFCWLHLLAGYFASYIFGRRIGLVGCVAAAAALCWSLCGFALIAGRCWYYMTPVFVYVPLLGVSAASLINKSPSWRWIFGTAVVIGLFFHAGNAQMWVYGAGFYVLTLLVLTAQKQITWRRTLQATPALIVGVGLAAVLLIPQLTATRDLVRTGGDGGGVLAGLHAMLLPYPFAKAELPCGWGVDHVEYNGHFYFAGGVFHGIWLFGLLGVWMFRGASQKMTSQKLGSVFYGLPLLALLLALDKPGVLWIIHSKLPMLSKFTHPMKLLPFFHFFVLAGGALMAQRLVRFSRRSQWWLTGCFIVAATLTVYHVSLARPAYYTFADHNYSQRCSATTTALTSLSSSDRIVPVAPKRSPASGYAHSLMHNFPTIYSVESFFGYDPLVAARPEWRSAEKRLHENFLETLRAYGVSHVVVHRTAREPTVSGNPTFLLLETSSLYADSQVRHFCAAHRPVAATREVQIYNVENTDPLAFVSDSNKTPLKLISGPEGAILDVSGVPNGAKIIVNYLWRPQIRIRGAKDKLDSQPDEYGRIVFKKPPGSTMLSLRYESPWLLGCLVGACLVVIGLCAALVSALSRTRIA